MQLVALAIPVTVLVPELMGSEVLVGARVCSTDGEARESDAGSTFIGPEIDEFNSLCSNKGTSNTSESSSWIKKANTESCRRSGLLSKLATEDVPLGLDHGTTSCSVALMSASEGKQTQWKIGKVQRNGTGSFKKLRMLQTEDSLSQAEADDTAVESDKLGMHLVKCSNADKSAAIKQKSNINGKRGDRRNYRVQMKAKYDSFSLKAGLPNFILAGGGSNAFGIYGLKPDIHDVTKFTNDILLDELLSGSYKYPTQGKDKEKEAANVNEIILDSVGKACSVLRLRGLQQGKQTDELDNHDNKRISLLSPSRISAAKGSDGDASSLNAGLSKCGNDLESCIKAGSLSDMHNNPSFQPKDVLERLALPSPKDLDSLLQDALKPAASGKLTDSGSSKSLSPGVTLPPFSWSNNFNGHYKSNNDATKISNKTTCHGKWVRIRSTSTFIGGGGYDSFIDLESLTYDGSLVPAGHIKYKLPEIEKTSLVFASQYCCRQNISSAACSTTSPLPHALHSPTVLSAAQTLCDIASHWIKHNSNGIMKWPKHPSQKAMKARKSRSNDKTEDNFPTPNSGTILDRVVRGVESGSSLKKPKISVVEKKKDFSYVQAIIGLNSVSASRSSWSSPNRFSRDSIAESQHCKLQQQLYQTVINISSTSKGSG